MRCSRKAILCLVAFVCLTGLSTAAVPSAINYQGRLTDTNGVAVDTTVDLTFSIFADDAGSTLLWTETHTSVTCEEGLFSVVLGTDSAFPADLFDGQVRYLGIQVGSGPLMTDLLPVVSTAYSIRSVYADTADFAHAGAGTGSNGWVDDGSKVRLQTANDNVGIGTADPSEQLVVGYDIGGYGGKYIVSGAEFIADVCGYKMGFSNQFHATMACDGDGAPFAVHTRESGVDYSNTIVARGGNVGINVTNPTEPLVVGKNIGTYGGNRVVIGDVTPGVGTGLVIGEDANSRCWILWDVDDNTLSIGSKEGGTNYGNAITIGGGTVELFDDAISDREILDEPGIGRYDRSSRLDIQDSWTTICERSCTFPTSGYAVVLASCEVDIYVHNYHADFGITLNGGGAPHIYTSMNDVDDQVGAGYQIESFHEVFSVSAGTNTFALLAIRQSGFGPDSYDASLTVMFFPTNYGMVSKVDEAGSDQSSLPNSGAQPMLYTSDGNSTAAEKSSTDFNRDASVAERLSRLEEENAELRQRLTALEDLMGQ